jgi:type IV secretion system protein VirD4
VAEGLLTVTILQIAESCPPEKRYISAFKIIQDLLAPSPIKGENQFQILIEKLPPNHKARWFAGVALNTVNTCFAR